MASRFGSLWALAEAINKAKAYLVGNGMDRVLTAVLDFAKTLPKEKLNDSDFLEQLLNIGVVKQHQNKTILIKLQATQREREV